MICRDCKHWVNTGWWETTRCKRTGLRASDGASCPDWQGRREKPAEERLQAEAEELLRELGTVAQRFKFSELRYMIEYPGDCELSSDYPYVTITLRSGRKFDVCVSEVAP